MNAAEYIREYLTGNLVEELDSLGLADPIADEFGVDEIDVDWNHNKEPGIIRLKTDKGNFIVRITVEEENK